MHILFRQLAQQMGLQNTRAILPEQIDMLINMSISDITNDRLKTFNSANLGGWLIDITQYPEIHSLFPKEIFNYDEMNKLS